MSYEYLPQNPNDPNDPYNRAAEQKLAGVYFYDPVSVEAAMHYVDEVSSSWILDPSVVTVEQPANQEELLENLDLMLSSYEDGEQLAALLTLNIAVSKNIAGREGFNFGVIKIKTGFDMKMVDTSELTNSEYYNLYRKSLSEAEYISDADQPNVMITGLLMATGAQLIRDDVSERGGGMYIRVYKGMLEGEPVYFTENIIPHLADNEKGGIILRRSFFVESEQAARFSLNTLSAEDEDVLKSIGVEIPRTYSSDYNSETFPTRSSMIETIKLYAAMNPLGNDNIRKFAELDQSENIVAREAEIKAEERSQLLLQQNQRDIEEEIIIVKFRDLGRSEKFIQNYRDELSRMKKAELIRGRLFPHHTGYVRFEALTEPAQADSIDIGIGTGFEQGSWVSVLRSSGEIEHDWTFMGIDRESGLAIVATIDEVSGEHLTKRITLDELKKFNSH